MKAAAAARTRWAALRRRTPESRAASALRGAASHLSSYVLMALAVAMLACAVAGFAVTVREDQRLAAERHAALELALDEVRGVFGDSDGFDDSQAAAGRTPRGPEGFALRHRRGLYRRARSAVAARRARPHRRLVQLGGRPVADPRRDLAVGSDRRGRGRARRLRLSRRRPDPAAGALAGVEPQNHPQADPRGRADRLAQSPGDAGKPRAGADAAQLGRRRAGACRSRRLSRGQRHPRPLRRRRAVEKHCRTSSRQPAGRRPVRPFRRRPIRRHHEQRRYADRKRARRGIAGVAATADLHGAELADQRRHRHRPGT